MPPELLMRCFTNQGDLSDFKELLNSVHVQVHHILPAYILHVVGDKFDIYKEQCDDRIQELTY